MIYLIIGCMLSGLSLLYFLKFDKISIYLLFSLPIGVALNSILFWVFCIFGIEYGKYAFLVFTFLSIIFLIFNIVNSRYKLNNDLKCYSIFYFAIILYVAFRLILMAKTSFFDFYNTDEFTAYLKYSNLFYLTHHIGVLKNYFLPVMHFLSTVTFDINNGFDLSICRTITPIFFILISFFIYYCLSEEKVNKYLASLISILFIFSSSENMVLAKTFYTNIIFSFYIISGTYLFFKNYNKKNNYLVLSLVLLLAASLTRSEGFFVFIAICFYGFMEMLIKNKKIKKYMFLIFIIPIILYSVNYIANSYLLPDSPHEYQSLKINSSVNQDYSKLKMFKKRTTKDNLDSFYKNLYDQTLSNSWYYYNGCIYIIFLASIIIYIGYLIVNRKNSISYVNGIFFTEFIYLLIIMYTQLFIFKEHEFMVAASFSRYTLAFIPLNYIIVGTCLFRNTRKEKLKKEQTKCKKIKNPKILLIIPAYNEEKCILSTYNKILDYNKKNNLNYDVVVINDGSVDKTKDICMENNIPIISLICNLGIGGAVQTGYRYAYNNNYDIAVQYDADGQHDIAYIDKLIDPIISGRANMVIGSRFIKKEKDNFKSTFLRRVGIRLISRTIQLCTRKKIYDTTSGFRAIDKSIIEIWQEKYPYEYPEPITNFDLLKHSYVVEEVPVIMHERKDGKSSIHTWKSIYYMINVILTILIKNVGSD